MVFIIFRKQEIFIIRNHEVTTLIYLLIKDHQNERENATSGVDFLHSTK